MSWLLLFVPVAVALELLAPDRHLLVFLASALAILPLAGWMGRATEQLATRLGEGVGGLLNATFGNAAELIIAFAALRAGLHTVVKASLVGSIVGNALKSRMELSLSIAKGSSVQVALFVAPLRGRPPEKRGAAIGAMRLRQTVRRTGRRASIERHRCRVKKNRKAGTRASSRGSSRSKKSASSSSA